MKTDHFSHQHPLILLEEEENNYETGEDDFFPRIKKRCHACLDRIKPSSGAYYSCAKKCKFFLHKFCAELPREIEHPLHPQHALTLFHQRECGCDGCGLYWSNFTYTCSPCDFDLDIICATLMERKIDHESHIHPLIRLRKPGLFHCDACSREHQGVFYQCPTCFLFLIHEDCFSYPTTIKHSIDDHPLILAYSRPSQHFQFQVFCDICTHYVAPRYWVYYCSICRTLLHVNCATSTIKSSISILFREKEEEEEEEEEDDDDDSGINLTRFPVVDQSVTLISYILARVSITEDECSANQDVLIDHFSHDHPLLLDVRGSSDMESSSQSQLCLMNDTRVNETICNACVKPIFATPFYKCSNQCDFFLHKCCAELPSLIDQHPYHPQHPLILLPKSPTFFNLFKCQGCHMYCNGFSYNCSECNFDLDVQCGSLPITIKHEAHDQPNHTLSLKGKVSNRCNACYEKLDEPILAYVCNNCDFELHSCCALSANKVRHRYDKHHPFTLTYSPIKGPSNDYYCELCEQALNPKTWFYHCSDCDKSIHIKCLRPFYRWSNLKYGGTLNIESHQHPLALAPVIEDDTKFNNSLRVIIEETKCNKCCNCLYYWPDKGALYPFGFGCVECNFTLCYKCAEPCNEDLPVRRLSPFSIRSNPSKIKK